MVCDSCFHLKTLIWVTHSNFMKDIWITYSNVVKGSMYYLEKAMATYSSTLAWKVPWMEEPGRLQSMGLLSRTWLSNFTFTHWRRKWQPTRVLAWRIPGTGESGGLTFMGSHRVGHDWSDLAKGCHIALQHDTRSHASSSKLIAVFSAATPKWTLELFIYVKSI